MKKVIKMMTMLSVALYTTTAVAQDPIIQTKYTADPAPMVYNDTVYLYTTHDEDDADGFKMLDWLLYTSTDMVNWTDRGVVASLKSFSWVKRDNGAWAEQVIERNGKFYMYCPIHGNGIGVLVADSPYGPFKDPINKPLVWQKEHWDDIDPTVFIDDDGQAYMYWGNPNVYYVKLNEDMISYSGEVVKLENKPEHYQEGPWCYKRDGHYYMAFASTCCPEGIGYAMSETPTGPWTTKGYIMRPTDRSRGNHPGIIDYKGKSYVFGLNYDILRIETPTHHERRSVSVAEMHYNPDGTIQEVPYWKDTKLQQIESFNPYRRVEAETMAWGYGLKTDQRKDGGIYVTCIDDGDTLRLRGVDFGKKGAARFMAAVASDKGNCSIEIHLDNADGPVVGTLQVEATGGPEQYKLLECPIKGAQGKHDLVFRFRGAQKTDLFNWDYWRFVKAGATFTQAGATFTQVDEERCFTNPMLWADVPDPDVIRTGDDFYLVSTTMHLMPGAPVMHSKDLVNWEIVSYVFDKLTDTPNYDLQQGTAYGRGQWATSLRYHNGKYYIYFSPNDKPYRGYVYSTSDPKEGNWELVARLPHFHDASLFFDDDGKAYIFYGTGQLRELKPDLTDVMPGGVDMKIFERDASETGLLEGSRFIKHNGKYYLLMISWPAGGKRRQVCYRADKITGPYEKKVILESDFGGFPYVGQGCILDDAKGNWYGVIFQDRGGVGRVLTLMPCRWVDGWPMLGDENGRVPGMMEKPVQGYPETPLVVSDDFNGKKLNLYWQWNHNPVDKAWSLTERPGYLRLKTTRRVDNLFLATNTLTQRMEGPRCSGRISIDVSHMKNGDRAGFSAFNGDAALLTVKMEDGKKYLVMETNVVSLRDSDKAVLGVKSEEKERVELTGDVIYLRIDGDFRPKRDIATCYYSLDNEHWTRIGTDFKMVFDYRRLFMGTKFAIFNYATKKSGGYVDVDFFGYERIQ